MGDYDAISELYEEYGKRATTDWVIGHSNVAKLLEPIQGQRILDYGCGNGKLSVYLSHLGAAIVGIDVSESQLAVAKRGPDTTIVYLLDTDPSIDTKYKGYFDKAALVFVLCEIPKREKVIAVLQRVHSLLKDGGTLIVLNPNWDKSNGKDFLTHQMKFTSDLHSGGAVTTILKTDPPIHIPDFYWSKQDYLAMLSEAGFSQHDIFEPLAPDDGTAWKDEKNYPPFLIIKCLKI